MTTQNTVSQNSQSSSPVQNYFSKVARITLYSLVLLSSLFIGADCAINAAFYLGNISVLAQFAVGIGIAALSGFVLNFILYALDAPAILADLPQSLLDDLSYFWVAFGCRDLIALFDGQKIPNEAFTVAEAWQALCSSSFCNVIALGSGAVMGLFTYYTYLNCGFIMGGFAQPLVIAMCLAYAILTFTLIRSALSAFFKFSSPARMARLNQEFVASNQSLEDFFNSNQISYTERAACQNYFNRLNERKNGTPLGQALPTMQQLIGAPKSVAAKILQAVFLGKIYQYQGELGSYDERGRFVVPTGQGSKIWQILGQVARITCFLGLSGMCLIATGYTAYTWALGTYNALIGFGLAGPIAVTVAALLASLVLLGETIFALKACCWVMLKVFGLEQQVTASDSSKRAQPENSEQTAATAATTTTQRASIIQRVIFSLMFGGFILFNAVGNAAIACNGDMSTWGILVAVFGAVLSVIVMYQAIGESTNETFTFSGLWSKLSDTFDLKIVSVWRPLLISASVVGMMTIMQLNSWQVINLAGWQLATCYISLAVTILLLQFVIVPDEGQRSQSSKLVGPMQVVASTINPAAAGAGTALNNSAGPNNSAGSRTAGSSDDSGDELEETPGSLVIV